MKYLSSCKRHTPATICTKEKVFVYSTTFFIEGRISIDDDPHKGRPKQATNRMQCHFRNERAA